MATGAAGAMLALGIRVKLGWAVGIAVDALPADGAPMVIARRDVRLAARDGLFGYHAALKLDDPEARAEVIAAADALVTDAATDALAEVVDEIAPSVVAVVVGRGVRRIPLDRILASSQLLHTAEAEVLQAGFIEAADRLGMACVRLPFATVEGDDAWPLIESLARSAGRPWQKDHKLAATAAWIARRTSSSSSVVRPI